MISNLHGKSVVRSAHTRSEHRQPACNEGAGARSEVGPILNRKSDDGCTVQNACDGDSLTPKIGVSVIESSVRVDRATLETAHAAKCELAGKVLRSFGSLRLQVTGLSMIPSVWPGDLLLIGRAHIGQIVAGDIVLFTRDGRFIAHRVVSRTGDNETTLLITRGDALPAQDSAITSAELLGKVSSIFCAGEWSEPRKRLSLSGRLIRALVSRFGRLGAVLVHMRMMRQRSGRRKRGCVR